MRALSFSGDSATGGRILFAPLIYAKFDTPQLVTLVNVFVDQMCTVSLRHWGCADSLWSDEELTTCNEGALFYNTQTWEFIKRWWVAKAVLRESVIPHTSSINPVDLYFRCQIVLGDYHRKV